MTLLLLLQGAPGIAIPIPIYNIASSGGSPTLATTGGTPSIQTTGGTPNPQTEGPTG